MLLQCISTFGHSDAHIHNITLRHNVPDMFAVVWQSTYCSVPSISLCKDDSRTFNVTYSAIDLELLGLCHGVNQHLEICPGLVMFIRFVTVLRLM